METTFNYTIVSQLLNILMQFTVAFFPLLAGVYAKEFFVVYNGKRRKKVELKVVLITAGSLSFCTMGFIPYLINGYGLSLTISGLFILGAGSKQIVEMLFDGRLLKIFLKFLGKSKDNLQESIEESIADVGSDGKKKK